MGDLASFQFSIFSYYILFHNFIKQVSHNKNALLYKSKNKSFFFYEDPWAML